MKPSDTSLEKVSFLSLRNYIKTFFVLNITRVIIEHVRIIDHKNKRW